MMGLAVIAHVFSVHWCYYARWWTHFEVIVLYAVVETESLSSGPKTGSPKNMLYIHKVSMGSRAKLILGVAVLSVAILGGIGAALYSSNSKSNQRAGIACFIAASVIGLLGGVGFIIRSYWRVSKPKPVASKPKPFVFGTFAEPEDINGYEQFTKVHKEQGGNFLRPYYVQLAYHLYKVNGNRYNDDIERIVNGYVSARDVEQLAHKATRGK